MYSGDYQSHCLLLGAIEERYELHIYQHDVQSLAEIKNVQTKDQRYYLHWLCPSQSKYLTSRPYFFNVILYSLNDESCYYTHWILLRDATVLINQNLHDLLHHYP